MPSTGNSGLSLIAYYPGDPTGASTAVLDIPTGTLVIDTTNNRVYQKTSTSDNSAFSLLAKAAGDTITGATITGATTSGILQKGTVTTLTGATDAIDFSLGDIFIINRSGAVNATTLANPAAGDEGRTIWIKNGTTQANTITVADGLGGSGTSYDVLTFTNVVAANVTLRAYGTKWYLVGQYLTAVA